jgi:hypothetical protein
VRCPRGQASRSPLLRGFPRTSAHRTLRGTWRCTATIPAAGRCDTGRATYRTCNRNRVPVGDSYDGLALSAAAWTGHADPRNSSRVTVGSPRCRTPRRTRAPTILLVLWDAGRSGRFTSGRGKALREQGPGHLIEYCEAAPRLPVGVGTGRAMNRGRKGPMGGPFGPNRRAGLVMDWNRRGASVTTGIMTDAPGLKVARCGESPGIGLWAWPRLRTIARAWPVLCVPRIPSMAMTSSVAPPRSTRDDHGSCACGPFSF